MKLTITTDDKLVYEDGLCYFIEDFSGVPDNVHALQWNSDTSSGWIEFNNNQPNESISALPEWAVQLEAKWQEANYINNNPPAPTDEELKKQCKIKAKGLLYASDWAVLPDVNITNKEDFVVYRDILRGLVLQPQVDPVFPPTPIAQWAS